MKEDAYDFVGDSARANRTHASHTEDKVPCPARRVGGPMLGVPGHLVAKHEIVQI